MMTEIAARHNEGVAWCFVVVRGVEFLRIASAKVKDNEKNKRQDFREVSKHPSQTYLKTLLSAQMMLQKERSRMQEAWIIGKTPAEFEPGLHT